MQERTETFSYTHPSGHPNAGEKSQGEFTWTASESDEEALTTAAQRGWTVVGMVNEKVKSAAKSNAYQAATRVIDQALVRKNLIANFIKAGFDEDAAIAQVDSLLASRE